MDDLARSHELDVLRRLLLDAPPEERAGLLEKIDALEDALEPVAGGADPTGGQILHHGETDEDPMLGGAEDLELDVRLRMTRIPTGIVHLLSETQYPLVSVTVRNDGSDPLRIAAACEVLGYSAEACRTCVVEPGATMTIDLLPTFFPDRIGALNDNTRATLSVSITLLDEDRHHTRTTAPIWLFPKTTAFRRLRDPSKVGEVVDVSRFLAAYVTPNAPEIMELLRDAIDHHPGQLFDAYQRGRDGVRAQVRALYDTLRDREITYVNSITCYGHELDERAQRCRLPRESLARRSANCLDGTVLMASLFEAASLEAAVVVLRGHALVAWSPVRSSDEWLYLETTKVRTLPFEEAVSLGTAQVKKGKSDLVKIPLARRDGIWPME